MRWWLTFLSPELRAALAVIRRLYEHAKQQKMLAAPIDLEVIETILRELEA